MTSSNKHWPSMFKAKGSKNSNPWLAGNNSSLGASRAPSSMFEERTPELKERWNPRPEQIRILETVFNSGMVAPLRDVVVRIRARLEEYGQVSDSSVFYWFQNRKSRSKNKNRRHKGSMSASVESQSPLQPNPPIVGPSMNGLSSSSSSSSGNDFLAENPSNFLYPNDSPPLGAAGGSSSAPAANFPQGLGGFPDVDFSQPYPDLSMGYNPLANEDDVLNQFGFPTYQGVGEMKATVMTNDVAYEVTAGGPINVRELFGDGVVLLQYPSGQPVLTNEWGFTLQPLQHGGFYCSIRTSP